MGPSLKNRFLLLASILTLFFGALFLSSHQEISFADDDEEHDEDDEDENDDAHEEDAQRERIDPSMKTSEINTLPITTTTIQTTTTTLNDQDGDGLYDNEDPHPDIPEFIIVPDENKNGIVDTFEESSG